MNRLSAALSAAFGCRKPRAPRPSCWVVTFSNPVNGSYCIGVFDTKREALEAARTGIRPDCAPSTPSPRYGGKGAAW